jgi:hypothetical protein
MQHPDPHPPSPSDIDDFAKTVLGKELYHYQLEAAHAILTSVLGGHGRIFTVMMSRQSGKNQLSAVLEAFLLDRMQEGTIVKAAPTFRPQIINSRLRLLSLLGEKEVLSSRLWQSQGYIVGLAPKNTDAETLRKNVQNHIGPRVMFFSAAPFSNVVGATADLLLEIDEAQNVTSEKFDRDFRPMASTKNATTVLYGTAWSDHTLLAHQRASNLELQQRTGLRLHFEYDWHVLAELNPAYRTYVESEIARLGEDHQTIQTQYLLRPISGADTFLNALQQTLLRGEHSWQENPSSDSWYIAGMDIAGEDRPTPGLPMPGQRSQTSASRDSTVITIGRVHFNELNLPCIDVVHQQLWTGMPFPEQLAGTIALVEQWGIRSLVVDATGLGAGLASMLVDRLGTGRVHSFIFSRPSKSRLAYQLLSLLNSGRLKLYIPSQAPQRIVKECWHQLERARYRYPAPGIIDFYVDPSEGHDDFLTSLALLAEAVNSLQRPAVSAFIHPPQLYPGESPY